MERRLVLAFVLVALLGLFAGCSAAGSLSMEPIDDDAELAELASRAPTAAGYPDDVAMAVVSSTIENGSATMNGTEPPVRNGLPVEYRERYYNLSWRIVDTHTEHSVSIEIDFNATNVTGTTIQLSDLPPRDRAALRNLLNQDPPQIEQGYDFGGGFRYTDEQLDNSVIVSPQKYDAVVYEGQTYPFRVEEPRPVTVNTYEYSATVVAKDGETYARQLRKAYAFKLGSLPEAERKIVTEATNGSYYAESSDDKAFGSLLDRFLAHEAVMKDDYSGKWLVRYDGQLYWADLDFGAFVDEENEETITSPAETPN